MTMIRSFGSNYPNSNTQFRIIVRDVAIMLNMSITVTSQERHGVSGCRQLDRFLNNLYADMKESY